MKLKNGPQSTMCMFDPTPDAIDYLSGENTDAHHAVASLLDPDAAIQLLKWIVEQQHCRLATASMIFWRMSTLAPSDCFPLESRLEVVSVILSRLAAGAYTANDYAWNGIENGERVKLLGADPLPELADFIDWERLPSRLHGPFGTRNVVIRPHPDIEDDWFESLWRITPSALAGHAFAAVD